MPRLYYSNVGSQQDFTLVTTEWKNLTIQHEQQRL